MKQQLVSSEVFEIVVQAAHNPHIFADDADVKFPMQRVIHNGVLYVTPLRNVA